MSGGICGATCPLDGNFFATTQQRLQYVSQYEREREWVYYVSHRVEIDLLLSFYSLKVFIKTLKM